MSSVDRADALPKFVKRARPMSLACAVRSSQRTEYHLYRTRRRRCVCAGYETRTGCALFTARDPESEDQLHQQRPRESKAATLLGFRAALPCTARGDTCEKTTHLALARERPCLRTCLQVAGEGDGYPCPFRKVDPAWLRVVRQNRRMIWPMIAVLRSLAMFIIDLFKSRRRLEVENLVLRHQLSIALRRAGGSAGNDPSVASRPPAFDCAAVTGPFWSG